MVMRCRHSVRARLAFARRADVASLAQGPATPDHAIRTKRVPMIGRDVGGYADAYRAYFDAHAPGAKEKKTMLDPAPRVVLDPELGLCTVGRTAKDAGIVADLYDHTIDVIERAERWAATGRCRRKDIFDVEYWDLEQAKLRKGAQAAGVRRRSRAGDRRRVGHRQGLRRSAARARRGRDRPRHRSRDR